MKKYNIIMIINWFFFSANTANSSGEEAPVSTITAIMLTYFVKYIQTDDIVKSKLWLDAVKRFLLDQQATRNDITITFQTSLSLTEELAVTAFSLIPMAIAAFAILSVFTFVSCFMLDWVRSKPWVALAGIIFT